MKSKKLIALFILLAIMISSFCSCEQIMDFIASHASPEQPTDSPAPENSDKPDSPTDVDGGRWLYSPDYFCYSIMPDKETYNYGEDINITVTARAFEYFAGHIDFSIHPTLQKDITFTLVESPAFEILGDSSISFENISFADYICEDEEGDAFVLNFKIRVNNPNYGINQVDIRADIHYYTENSEFKDADRHAEFIPLYFISDSQGVIIYSMPYSYNHYYEDKTLNVDFLKTDKLIEKSLDREYLNGVAMDELIDRYITFMIQYKSPYGKKYYEINSTFNRVVGEYIICTYVTENIRFKIFLPDDQKYERTFDNSRLEYLSLLLKLAYDNGILTEDEYEAEIVHLHNSSVLNCRTGSERDYYRYKTSVFSFPEGNDYYNYVLDLR